MNVRHLILAPLLAVFVAQAAFAQKTPDHVFQAIGEVEATLRAILEADFVDTKVAAIEPLPNLRPRHVFAKVVEVSEKFRVMQRLHGLRDRPALTMPAQVVTSDDVYAAVLVLRARATELLEPYGLGQTETSEPLPTGKTSADAYARLQSISQLFDRAYQPPTVPNDVYRVSQVLAEEAALLLTTLGARKPLAQTKHLQGKTPVDGYDLAVALGTLLDELATSHSALAPEGGVVVPVSPSGEVTSGSVRDAVSVVLADLIEMRVNAGATDDVFVAEEPTGKTPSDVYGTLFYSKRLLTVAKKTRATG